MRRHRAAVALVGHLRTGMTPPPPPARVRMRRTPLRWGPEGGSAWGRGAPLLAQCIPSWPGAEMEALVLLGSVTRGVRALALQSQLVAGLLPQINSLLRPRRHIESKAQPLQ